MTTSDGPSNQEGPTNAPGVIQFGIFPAPNA